MAQTVDVAVAPGMDEDRVYKGSRFSDVVATILANPYQRVWGATGEPPLPVAEVSNKTVAGGFGRSSGHVSSRPTAHVPSTLAPI